VDQVELVALFRACRAQTDALLDGLADEFEAPEVVAFVRYAVGAGRRFRAFLTRVCFSAVGGQGDHIRYGMAAVELLHKASLIHDDIVDEDDLRRGRETVHHKFGVREGIVLGDLVAALAFDLIGRMGRESDTADLAGCYRFLSSGYRATALGELDDLLMEQREAVTAEEAEAMLAGKSGWLVATACGLGASAGGAPESLAAGLHEFGLAVGTAFQILNDVNSLTSVDAASKGVAAGDVRAKKKSLPVVIALAADGPDAEEFRRLWAKPQMAEADAARGVALIEAIGALDTCRSRATDLLAGAADHLTDLPDTPFAALLRAVPTSTITDAYWREMD